MQGALRRKRMTTSFVDHFGKIVKMLQYASSFHNPKLSQERYFMLYVKELITSFLDQFKLDLENIRCIDFQFHVAKLSQ